MDPRLSSESARRRIALELELAGRAHRRAAWARRRALRAQGRVRETLPRAADLHEVAEQAHQEAAELLGKSVAAEEGMAGILDDYRGS